MGLGAKLKYAISEEISAFIAGIIIGWPSNYIGMYLRARFYKKKLGKGFGENPQISVGTRISPHPNLEIGDNFIVGRNAYISAAHSTGIFIGNNVILAQGVFIRSANHSFSDTDVPINAQGHSSKEVSLEDGRAFSIIIEDDVWMGANALILSGVKIGRGSVIGAGAVVTPMDIPEHSIVAGNPARIIGKRV